MTDQEQHAAADEQAESAPEAALESSPAPIENLPAGPEVTEVTAETTDIASVAADQPLDELADVPTLDGAVEATGESPASSDPSLDHELVTAEPAELDAPVAGAQDAAPLAGAEDELDLATVSEGTEPVAADLPVTPAAAETESAGAAAEEPVETSADATIEATIESPDPAAEMAGGESSSAAAETADAVAETTEGAPAAATAEMPDAGAETADAVAETTEGAPAAATTTETAGEEPKRKRRRKRPRKRKLESFGPGEEIEGTVRSIQSYGAFVDVGAERDGLVHISELRDGFVEKVEDVVAEGDRVAVRIKEVDVERGRLSLTMRSENAPSEEGSRRTSLSKLKEGQEITGTVTSVVDFGAFVDIGAVTDGLIHISELSEGRVNRVTDVVREGDEVTARILGIDKRRNRISLTMREHVDPAEFAIEEDGEIEEMPSMMELAFERAKERNKKSRRESRKSKTPDDQLIDIIERTLENHRDD